MKKTFERQMKKTFERQVEKRDRGSKQEEKLEEDL